jgi:uncharacterized OB-fold protein
MALPDLEDELVAPFWRAAARGSLEIPCCAACGTSNWYPVAACRECGSESMRWTALTGQARIYSWAVVKRALHQAFAVFTPYVSIIAEPVDAPGVRIVSRLIDAESEALTVDAPIHVVFKDLGYPGTVTGVVAPFFTLDVGMKP